MVILKTASQALGTTYTVSADNLTEWGGYYTIGADQNTATFNAYRGKLSGLQALDNLNFRWMESGPIPKRLS